MKRLLLVTALMTASALPVHLGAQTGTRLSGFSVKLERTACLGDCPDYEVSIDAAGQVQYEGRSYVGVEGVRQRTIPSSAVQKFVERLQREHFFEWAEKKSVCVDFPEVHITATLGTQRKHVLEGCNEPGKILALANEIDRLAGTKDWVQKPR